MARTTMSDNDVFFETYLKSGSRLSSLYSQQNNELPSEAVDSAILAAARREVGSGPGNRAVRKWQIPASIAAGLVFAVGMVAVLNQRIIGLEGEQDVARVAMSVLESSAARQAQPAHKSAEPASQLAEPATEESEESMDTRQQTLARAAAGADEQAVAAARQSMASVATGSGSDHTAINVSKLTFSERFNLLQPGLKPSQIAVLLGEPGKKETSRWIYQRLTSVPGKSIQYFVHFNESSELVSWNIRQVQDQSESPAK